MSYDQFHRRLVMLNFFPEALIDAALRLAKPESDESRQELFMELMTQHAAFAAHDAKQKEYIARATQIVSSISVQLSA